MVSSVAIFAANVEESLKVYADIAAANDGVDRSKGYPVVKWLNVLEASIVAQADQLVAIDRMCVGGITDGLLTVELISPGYCFVARYLRHLMSSQRSSVLP